MRYYARDTKIFLNETDMERLCKQRSIEKRNLIIDIQDPQKQRTDDNGNLDTRPFVISKGDMTVTRQDIETLLKEGMVNERGLTIKMVEPKPKEPETPTLTAMDSPDKSKMTVDIKDGKKKIVNK